LEEGNRSSLLDERLVLCHVEVDTKREKTKNKNYKECVGDLLPAMHRNIPKNQKTTNKMKTKYILCG